MLKTLKKNKSEKVNVASNTAFYLIYQIILFVVPLVIMPYLTRVFTESTLGEYSFSYSMAYYFVLGANLGISMYGQREIASNKNNKEALTRKFWSLFYVHSVFSILSFIAFIIFFTVSKQIGLYVFIIPYVISALFDVTWFFYGLENFKLVTIVNASLALLKMCLVFVLVKNNNSLWVYQLISFGSVLLSQLCIFLFAVKVVGKPVKVLPHECFHHLKPILYFALAAIALTLYTYLDRTLLGIMVHDSKKSVAYYECADKVVAVPRMIITTLGTVLYPKMCAYAANKDKDKIRGYTLFSIDWTTFLSLGSIFGLIAMAVPFSMLYYGDSYIVSGYAMMMMAPLIFIISLGSICRTQYILPQKKDKIFLIAISLNAVVNLSLNVALIPRMGIYGVVLSSIVSELVGLLFQLYHCRKEFPFRYLLKSTIIHLSASFLMYVILLGVSKFINPDSWVRILLLFVIGILVYLLSIILITSASGEDTTITEFIKRRKIKHE